MVYTRCVGVLRDNPEYAKAPHAWVEAGDSDLYGLLDDRETCDMLWCRDEAFQGARNRHS